jgi:hypothetical protein
MGKHHQSAPQTHTHTRIQCDPLCVSVFLQAGAGQHLRGQLQHHQLPGHPQGGAGGPDLASLAEYMEMQQQQQGGAAQVTVRCPAPAAAPVGL